MTYDLIVIGSGPGGYSAAVRAGQYGLKTALIEKDPKLGGTCLLVGCIPTKSLLHTADVWNYIQHAEDEGISVQNPVLNFAKVIDRKNGIVNKHSKGIDFLMKKNKVQVIKGFATLKGGGKVEVKTEKGIETHDAKNILIATGSTARMFPGLQPDPDFILTNVEILNLTKVPKSLAIIGAGAVGVEFASMFKKFGADVSLFEMLPRLVPVEDEEVSKELERVFKKQKIRVETGAKCENIRKGGAGVQMTVTLADGKKEEVEAEKLLVAVGRAPNTAGIGLENTKVEVDRGVHQDQRIAADRGAGRLRDRRCGGRHAAAGSRGNARRAWWPSRKWRANRRSRFAAIASRARLTPSRASAASGLTEAQAKAQGYKVKVGKFPFVGNSKATILGNHDGFVKIVADEQYGEILGVHIIGPQAYELIAEAVAAMEAEATVETMMNTIHAHPTLYEAIGEGFQNVYGLAINA